MPTEPPTFRAPSGHAALLAREAANALRALRDDDQAGREPALQLARALRSLLAQPRIDEPTLVVLARAFDAVTLFQTRGRAQAFVEELERCGAPALRDALRARCARLAEEAAARAFPCQAQGCAEGVCAHRELCARLHDAPGEERAGAVGD